MAYVVCIVGIILMYIWYTPDPSCLLNIFFITWTLVLLQLMTSVSLHPRVSPFLPRRTACYASSSSRYYIFGQRLSRLAKKFCRLMLVSWLRGSWDYTLCSSAGVQLEGTITEFWNSVLILHFNYCSHCCRNEYKWQNFRITSSMRLLLWIKIKLPRIWEPFCYR